jgi:uncharacterized protein (TIGR03663 family)
VDASTKQSAPYPSESRRALPALAAFGLLVAYILATRLIRLDLRPVQHDESMFAYYSYRSLVAEPYEFLPILHGPLLEWATTLVFLIAGDSNTTMRLFPALCGVGVALVLWALRGTIGSRAALLAIAFLAISPTLLFFSRFCRNDIPFLFTAILLVWNATQYARSGSRLHLIAAILCAGLAVSIKETYVIFFFILLSYAVACGIHAAIRNRPLDEVPILQGLRRALTRHWSASLFGLVLASALVVTLYTSFFHYPRHWDGVVKALIYWTAEHRSHRIDGPYHFYLIHLAIYELPFLIFWAAFLAREAWRRESSDAASRAGRLLRWGWLALSLVTLVLYWDTRLPPFFERFAHMTLGLHPWMAVQLVVVVGAASWNHVERGHYFHAFADTWTGASLVIYSYAGEKVPWVTAHIVLPMLLSAALYADDLLREWEAPDTARPGTGRWIASATAAAGLGWLVWLSLFVNFVNAGNPIERHSYAGAHPQFQTAVDRVIDEALNGPMGYDTRIAFEGELAWPMWWHLRRFDFKTPRLPESPGPSFLIADELVYRERGVMLEGYEWERVRFRHYWQPLPLDWRAMRRIDLLLPLTNRGAESNANREHARNEWLKLLKATFLREEDVVGPTRWEHLGGLDAYVGRLKGEYEMTL